MARTKNYQVNPARMDRLLAVSNAASVAPPLSSTGDARIDMADLLGPEARFASSERTIDYNEWLGYGIDLWVWSLLECFRAMLMSGARQTSTVSQYAASLRRFFAFLTEGRQSPRVATPELLSPVHVDAFVGWLQSRGQQLGHTTGTVRTVFQNVKCVLEEMFAQGQIPGRPTDFFKRGALPWRDGESRETSLSDAEQRRLAASIKTDLVAIYHGRLKLNPGEVQALRLLLVVHRQGHNLTPILELRRDAVAPGPLPGTICMRTVKHRNRKVLSSVGRAAPRDVDNGREDASASVDMVFSLAEGAVLQQAIASTKALVKDAPTHLKSRVWLYRSQSNAHSKGSVICLTSGTLRKAIESLIERHNLLGDDGLPLRLNLSRLRKSYFDRVLRTTDGDLVKTANLMGNTPRVAGRNYPSMNAARQTEAAEFMNEGYINVMRGKGASDEAHSQPRPIEVKPLSTSPNGSQTMSLEHTPVSGCKDTLNGEHAPRDGRTHCDRYVMCLFCSSFAIVGTADELWRLFSFQTFASVELNYLDATLGPERTNDEEMEDLRDRYRVAIPFIDQFTQRQFPAAVIRQARAKTEDGLHPFWVHQMTTSQRSRIRTSKGGA